MNRAEQEQTTFDAAGLAQWVGRRETSRQIISPEPVSALWATLDKDEPAPTVGQPLPALCHWLYFLSYVRQSALGSDGHSRRGSFLPPVPLPRRMWAGSKITFHRPLTIGQAAERNSEILSVTSKEGRSGPLIFVTVRHSISDLNGMAITDEQDLVYRDAVKVGATAAPGRAAPNGAEWSRVINPDPVMLFRYSALTFNGHRIHYDRAYATAEEGYPGLVVHGPLIAALLVDLLCSTKPTRRLTNFRFRAVAPLFDGNPFSVNGRTGSVDKEYELWAAGPDRRLAVEAVARLD